MKYNYIRGTLFHFIRHFPFILRNITNSKLYIFFSVQHSGFLCLKFFQIFNVIIPFQTSVHKFQCNLKSISLKKIYLISSPLLPSTSPLFYFIEHKLKFPHLLVVYNKLDSNNDNRLMEIS